MASSASVRKFQMLPHARPGGIAGFLELLADRGGRDDLYKLADELSMDVDDLLPIVDASAMLGLVAVNVRRRGDHARGPRASPRPISRRRSSFSVRPR